MAQLADLVNYIGLVVVVPVMIENALYLFMFERVKKICILWRWEFETKTLSFQFLDRMTVTTMFLPFISVLAYSVLLFTIFFAGEILHSNCLQLSDIIYESEWYRYPHDIKRSILIVMIRAQQPYHLSIYGILKFRSTKFVEVRCK